MDFALQRESPFSYVCNACKRCCYNKAIRIGPYEILRLARYLAISTTEFISRYTEAGGTVLRTREDDRGCIFLNERGCGVHPDRPLACRIYPLARWVSPTGEESFGHLTQHPQTAGIYGTSGKVVDYLEGQGLMPFFDMGERYGPIYLRMVDLLYRIEEQADKQRTEFRNALDEMSEGTIGSPWLDVDATVAAYSNAAGLPLPSTIDLAIDMHIQALAAWLDDLEAELKSAGDMFMAVRGCLKCWLGNRVITAGPYIIVHLCLTLATVLCRTLV